VNGVIEKTRYNPGFEGKTLPVRPFGRPLNPTIALDPGGV